MVAFKVTRSSKASQPTGEAKAVPKTEGLTQVWPQQGLALHLKSPGNKRGSINHHPDTGIHTQMRTPRTCAHMHTLRQVESGWHSLKQPAR